jgi:hypothetical protein
MIFVLRHLGFPPPPGQSVRATTDGARMARTDIPFHDVAVAYCAVGAFEWPVDMAWTGETRVARTE